MFRKGEQVLVVDDLITRGDSKSEAIGPLQAAGLFVHDIAVLIDREQGGADVLTQRGYELHAVFKLSELLAELNRSGHVPDHQIAEVLRYIGRQ